MSIIPIVPRPPIAPNYSTETRFSTSLLIASDDYIYGAGNFIRLLWSDHTGIAKVQVDGTIWAASTTNVSAALAGMYIDSINVTGTVVSVASEANSEHHQGNATAIFVGAGGSSVANTGTILAVTDHGLATAIQHYGHVFISNSGVIAAQTGSTGEIASAQALGISTVNGGVIHNLAGGQILAEGMNATAIIMGRGETFASPDDANIINDGTIQAVSLGGAPSVGISVASLPHQWMRIENNGLIQADIAIRTGSSTWPPSPSDATIDNSATGIIRGDIVGDLGAETVINAGLIDGNVLLGEGRDVFDNSQGVLHGYASLGWGNDVFTGGDGADRVDGGRMDDWLSGGGGDDLLFGGFGDDFLDGGAGNDGLYGDYGDDRFVLSGADAAYGGAGDDRFELSDLAFARIEGGAGSDTVSLAGVAATVDLGQLLQSSRVSGIEAIDLGATGHAALDAAAAAGLDGLRITGSGAAALTLAGTWTAGASTIIGGESYLAYTAGNITIHVRHDLALSLEAAMPGNAVGLDAVAGGAAAPTLASEPAFVPSDPVWNNAFYNVYEDTVIGAYETWRAAPNSSTLSAYASSATVTNYGRLEGRTSVDMLTAFINHGIIINEASARAFVGNQSVPLVNTGSIISTSTNGTAEAALVDAPMPGDGYLALDNSGIIRATSTAGEAVGIYLMSTYSAVNSGEISAHGAQRATALYLERDPNFHNSGTIQSVLTGTDSIGASAAVYVAQILWGAHLSNSGLITGAVAIRADQVRYTSYQGVFEITNDASGRIVGDILLTSTDDVIANHGSITGNVSLGTGNDIFDSRDGIFTGSIDAGDGSDWIFTGRGNHSIDGGDNIDTAAMAGNRSDYAITQISPGVFQISGAQGTDTLTNVEFLQFDDQTIRLTPGTGTAVNFETADSSIYQSAMNAILDFDGNALGGNGSWLRIGSADVNGDGDIDQILVNREIGRFATVGTAPDGLVYFDDYGWAGETRVVGIYIDPLVTSGQVVAGSELDSQQRFQNDLNIENINRVLGAGDYDHDGLQEVYFALTDGTAYLHAYMHADGNIQYANYQSQQQVIDYLTANGFDSSTWADWFPGTAMAATVQAAAAPTAAIGDGGYESMRPAHLDSHGAGWADPASPPGFWGEFLV